MAKFYLNSYLPLVSSGAGCEASQAHGISPFVDGSIRREPDLEHELPSISCLCRASKFTPRLRVDDTIAYITRKAHYRSKVPHRRFTALLRVKYIFENHQQAAVWYHEQGMCLPNNCMVSGNLHSSLEHSHRRHPESKNLDEVTLCRRWDGLYRKRASTYRTFVVCQKLYCDLSWDSPIATDDYFMQAFGRVPGTQNPGALPESEFLNLLHLLGVGF